MNTKKHEGPQFAPDSWEGPPSAPYARKTTHKLSAKQIAVLRQVRDGQSRFLDARTTQSLTRRGLIRSVDGHPWRVLTEAGHDQIKEAEMKTETGADAGAKS